MVIGVQRGRPDVDDGVEPAPTLVRECVPAYQRGVTEIGERQAVRSTAQLPPSDADLDPFDLDPGDLGEASGDRAGQELHLGRPGRFVGLDGEHTVVETNRTNVCSDGVADGVVPSAEDAADLDAIGAAQRLHDPVE